MLTIRTTPHLYGISLIGDYRDLNELYDSLSRYLDFYNTNTDSWPYHAYEYMLSLNYDIRHAYMGTRGIEMVENNAEEVGVIAEAMYELTESDKKEFRSIRKDCKKGNLYFRVEILYPLVFHYLITMETILNDYLLPDKGTKSPEYMDEYSALQASHDRAQIRLFTALLWDNLAELLGNDNIDQLCHLFENQIRVLPMPLYTDALLHCQLAQYPGMTDTERKGFLLLAFCELGELPVKRTRAKEYQNIKEAAKNAAETLHQAGLHLPTQNNFYTKLEKSIPVGQPLYRETFDQFLNAQYGCVADEDREPDW